TCWTDDEVLCFKDISPGAEHHYLVVPRDHIKDCTYLQKSQANLGIMANMGLKVLHENNFTDMNDASFGFHLPPYTSVDHLHLHVLAPASQLYICSKYKYTPNHYRFITVSTNISLFSPACPQGSEYVPTASVHTIIILSM
uniref:HIT domain-containing protein n=1 Tax=Denticeps clupeoides TaxID=299321 RepID=A0AAY4AZQ3_9TELE